MLTYYNHACPGVVDFTFLKIRVSGPALCKPNPTAGPTFHALADWLCRGYIYGLINVGSISLHCLPLSIIEYNLRDFTIYDVLVLSS